MKKEDWFKNWFDSPYYHVLYKNRDKNEANVFIQNLVNWLQLDKSSTVLDLGCGKGRHAIELKKKYKKVVGIDLSKKSIDEAINELKEKNIDIIGDNYTYGAEGYKVIFIHPRSTGGVLLELAEKI